MAEVPTDEGVKLWVQNLGGKSLVYILSRVKVEGNKISIPGNLIDEMGTMAEDNGDISVPGLVLKLENQ